MPVGVRVPPSAPISTGTAMVGNANGRDDGSFGWTGTRNQTTSRMPSATIGAISGTAGVYLKEQTNEMPSTRPSLDYGDTLLN